MPWILPGTFRRDKVVTPKPAEVVGVGARTRRIYKRWGFTSCPLCYETAELMDANGAPWCRRNVAMLADTTLQNLRDNDGENDTTIAQKFRTALLKEAAEIGPVATFIRSTARRVILAACDEEDAANPPIEIVPGDGLPRVGMVSQDWLQGGVERHWDTLVEICQGVEFSGVCVTGDDWSEAAVEESRRRCPILLGRDTFPDLLSRTDVLLVWGNAGRLPELSRWGGQVVFVSHGMGQWTKDRAKQHAPRADAIVAVSEMAKTAVPKDHQSRTRIILNGVDPQRVARDRPREEIRAEWGVGELAIAVGYCGRYSPEKNPAAAALAVSQIPEAVAVYQCPTWTWEKGMATVRDLVGDRSVWPRGPVHDFYAAVDCMVMASDQEGFSLAVIEAWMAGVPVIATPVGAVPEMEKRFGPLTVPVPLKPTPEQLAAAVRQAINPVHREIVAKAQTIALEQFNATRFAKEWTDLFKAITPAASPSGGAHA